MDEKRVEELLWERAERRAQDSALGGKDGTELRQSLARTAAAQAASERSRRPRIALLSALAVAAALALLFGPRLLEPATYGAVEIEIALLDASGRTLDSEVRAGPGAPEFVRPAEFLLEFEPARDGHLRVLLYGPGGQRSDAGGPTELVLAAGTLAYQTYALESFAALAEGTSFVDVLVVASSRSIPAAAIERGAPARLPGEASRDLELATIIDHLRTDFGCTVVRERITLEVR